MNNKKVYEVYISNGCYAMEQTFYSNREEAEQHAKQYRENGYYDYDEDYNYKPEELFIMIKELG